LTFAVNVKLKLSIKYSTRFRKVRHLGRRALVFVIETFRQTDLDRGRQRRRENGVLCPCMDMPRHFDNLSYYADVTKTRFYSQSEVYFPEECINMQHSKHWRYLGVKSEYGKK
jgi:hypothetical protein